MALRSRSLTKKFHIKICVNAYIFQTIRWIWFIFDVLIDIGPKNNPAIPHPGHRDKTAAMTIYDKNFKNLYIPNQKADNLETLYLALAIKVLPN